MTEDQPTPKSTVDSITRAIINSPLLEFEHFINKIANTEFLEELRSKMASGEDDYPVTRILLISERLRDIYGQENPEKEDES